MNKLRTALPFVALVALVAFLFGQGCGTATIYKTTGVVTVTGDRAADAWADYVVWQKRQPDYDAPKLASQEAQARVAYTRWQASLETVYAARTAYKLGLETNGDALNAALTAAQAASDQLINLVLTFLPADRAAQLKTTP